MPARKKIVDAELLKDIVITECSNEARVLSEKSEFGTVLKDGRVQLTLIEGYYLLENDKISIRVGKRDIDKKSMLRRCVRKEKNFLIRYAVFADFRNRGYVIKTALKFGADFRVYDKGVKPGEDHAKWIVYPVKETDVMTWYEFAAKNRVAHSTKKMLLIGVVDEENSVTYYEIRWTRP
jgi:tRNA-intron endonuclease